MGEQTPDRFICWPPALLGEVIKGSVIRHCNVCLGEVNVAPSTLKIIKREAIRAPVYWCVPCAGRELRRRRQAGTPVEVLGAQPEQLSEIAEHARKSKQ